jgi:hypothetical protein
MGIREILINLNTLKTAGTIQDYAIAGGYACMFYDVQRSTYDLDVLVVLPSEDDFHRLYQHFQNAGNKIENVYIFIGDMPVQFFPNYIGPLYNAAITEAKTVEFENVDCKFVSVEYLIALLLTAFREKDRIRISSLLGKADKVLLADIVKRYDDGKSQLSKRYKEILAGTG